MTIESNDYNGIVIPTYIINLENRKDRLAHIKKEFENRNEFEIKIVPACINEVGAVGLWSSIVKVVNMAIENDDDVIIICEDDHKFTENYSRNYLFRNIIEANEQGANVLLGGIGGFRHVVPLTLNRLWMDFFWCTQFLVVYKKFFKAILDEPFTDIDTADGKLSEMTSNKMVIYPFVSVQIDFGYSDVTKSNNETRGHIVQYFEKSSKRLSDIMKIHNKYKVLSDTTSSNI